MEIIGHHKQKEFFKKAIQLERLSHAYLFAGQEELGKRTLALEIVSTIFGSNQKIENHPDFMFIKAESKDIQISQIRELIRKISLKPSLAKRKIAVIDNAHLMNKEAQTCLLKTLEEPRGNCLLILISDKPGYLFPTIISRLQTIKFNLVEKKLIEKYLFKNNLLKKEVEEISEISLGRSGKAINLFFDKKNLENFKLRAKELDKISACSLFFRFQYIKKITENLKEVKEVLDVWLYCYRQKFLKNPTRKLKNIINLIEITRYLILNTNVNSKLALERLVLEI